MGSVLEEDRCESRLSLYSRLYLRLRHVENGVFAAEGRREAGQADFSKPGRSSSLVFLLKGDRHGVSSIPSAFLVSPSLLSLSPTSS